MKNNNRLIIFFVSISFFMNLVAVNINASVVGDYYVQNFTGLTGTNFSWYDEGLEWGSIHSSHRSQLQVASDKLYFNSTGSSWDGRKSYINFTTIPTTFFNFTISEYIATSVGGSTITSYMCLKNMLGVTLVNLSFWSSGAANNVQLQVRDKGGVLLNDTGLVPWDNIEGNYKFSFIQMNNSINIESTALGYLHIWKELGVDFDTNFYFKLTSHTTNPGWNRVVIDNLYFLSGVSYVWEITSDYSFGSVLQTDSGNYSSTLTATEKYQLVEKYPLNTHGGILLRQFAFAVSTSTELSKITVLLHINGMDYGYYDNSYFYGGDYNIAQKYILVWTNINETFVTDHLTIEILVTAITYPAVFSYPVYLGDIEGDGVIEFKETQGLIATVLPYFDGIYDGEQTFLTKEPMYKIWFGSSSSTTLCGIDFSGYSSVGLLYTGTTTLLGGNFIEILYNIPSTLNLKGFQIIVNEDTGSSVYNYHLKINGEPYGAADCISIYSQGFVGSDDMYKLTWNFTKIILDSTILFEVASDNPLGIMRSTVPIDDYSVGVKYHSSYSLFNGIYDGSSYSYDVCYKFYYDSLSVTNQTSPHGNCLITVPKLNWFRYETIPIYWELNDSSYSCEIYLYRNGVQYDDGDFPLEIPLGQFSGDTSYFAFLWGSYKFSIVRNSETLASCNITVSNLTDSNFILSTYPIPYEYNTEFTIFYRYYKDTGENGLIVISTSNSINDSVELWDISSNSTGNLSYRGTNDYYVMMYTRTSSGSYYKLKTIFQMLYSNVDSIFVTPGSYRFSATISSILEHIYGQNKHYGFSVYVKLNNEVLEDVGNKVSYSITKLITSSGSYKASLNLETVNGSLELVRYYFNITAYSEGAISDDPWYFLGVYKYVFAIGIIIMFLFLPMTVASRLGVDLPMIANIGSAALGLSFCTLSGLLPIYVIFFTVVAMVAGALIVMFLR